MASPKQKVLDYVDRFGMTLIDNSNARVFDIKVLPPEGQIFWDGLEEIHIYRSRYPGLTKTKIWWELENDVMCGTITPDYYDKMLDDGII